MNDEKEPRTKQIISVVQRLVRMIELQELRVHELRAREHASGQYTSEMRRNIEVLQNGYTALSNTLRALDLEAAAYRRGPRPPGTTPSDAVVSHPVYTFLKPDEARQLLRLEEQVDAATGLARFHAALMEQIMGSAGSGDEIMERLAGFDDAQKPGRPTGATRSSFSETDPEEHNGERWRAVNFGG